MDIYDINYLGDNMGVPCKQNLLGKDTFALGTEHKLNFIYSFWETIFVRQSVGLSWG